MSQVQGPAIAVLGAGSWGTALSWLLGGKGYCVRLWGRDQQVAAAINARHRNPRYLSSVTLPDTVRASLDLAEALSGAQIVVLAVPCEAVAEVMEKARGALTPGSLLVSATKGLDPASGRLASQIVAGSVPSFPREMLVVLSGPNLASEMVRRVPTATVVASFSAEAALGAQETFADANLLRVYTSTDVLGVQLGGALKNIIALAAGICDGLGFGDNTKATLVTRGLREMTRLGCVLGAEAETFSGLSGVGDLFATCSSRESRNWRVGFGLAQGRALADILREMGMVAEGAPTTRAALGLAQQAGVEAPITSEVHAVLFEGKPPARAVSDLMSRAPKSERA